MEKKRDCFHCGQEYEAGHDCWTTTEAALTQELDEDLKDAYERIRDTALEFGPQRSYASHKSIMFSREACYFFVRPKKAYLEVVFFLGRTVRHPAVLKTVPSSKTKTSHLVRIRHRDEVEGDFVRWLHEAYERSPELYLRKKATPKVPVKKAKKKPSSREWLLVSKRPKTKSAAKRPKRS